MTRVQRQRNRRYVINKSSARRIKGVTRGGGLSNQDEPYSPINIISWTDGITWEHNLQFHFP